VVRRFGLPARELWLIVAVVLLLSGGMIAFAASVPAPVDSPDPAAAFPLPSPEPGGIPTRPDPLTFQF
jgi:hypothetical protein